MCMYTRVPLGADCAVLSRVVEPSDKGGEKCIPTNTNQVAQKPAKLLSEIRASHPNTFRGDHHLRQTLWLKSCRRRSRYFHSTDPARPLWVTRVPEAFFARRPPWT